MQAANKEALNQPGGEQQKSIGAERLQALGRFRRAGNNFWMYRKNRARAGDNNKKRDYGGHDTADDHLDPRFGVFLGRNPLLDHCCLKIELHPRRDSGPYHTDQHLDIAGVQQPEPA